MNEYVPSPRKWVADQVEQYEGSGGTAGLTFRDTALPVIIVTNRGRKTGAIRKNSAYESSGWKQLYPRGIPGRGARTSTVVSQSKGRSQS